MWFLGLSGAVNVPSIEKRTLDEEQALFDGLAGRVLGVAGSKFAGSLPIRRVVEQVMQRRGHAICIDPATEQFTRAQCLHPMRKKRLLDMPWPHRQWYARQ